MTFVYRVALSGFVMCLCGVSAAAPITRIWLTHKTSEPSKLMVNWESKEAGPSRVEYGASEALGESAASDKPATLHHVEIPFPQSGLLHYRVSTGGEVSAINAVKSYSGETLRIAATANWQFRPAIDGLIQDDPHLLLSCGDMVLDVVTIDNVGATGNTQPFATIIDRYPALFARVPFLPALGNHERQIRYLKEGQAVEAIYDLEATAFRSYFPLPEDGRRYYFDVPAFGTRLVALDLSHIRDVGTLRQSCQPFNRSSEQFQWYREVVKTRPDRFMLTYFNESGPNIRAQEKGMWENMLRQGSAVLSGFGSFAERAEVRGMPYFTSALKVLDSFGDKANGKFYRAVEGYTLVTIPKNDEMMTVELKKTDGTVLDRSEWPSRPQPGSRQRIAQ